ncbi:N-acetyltransferase [uncultured Prevotella sp.]|uniref:N-acetyltransferase n=1 Tax=uncultured Prevotella sp. TaxID=159272 RepID=UPI00258C9F87|nr:N-acetyltransferase [uncultured Prevotella sp.]
MSSIEIKRVTDKRGLDTFIQLHYDLYRGNKFDAPNLYRDEVNTLSRDKNSAFDFCEAEYFLAYRDGKVVGRVAAIINHRYNEQWQRPCVRFGWLDLIDDAEVMRALLNAVEEYGKQKGMKEIIGPLGFTDMDPEGMLTYGFDQLGTMATLYNYEYYPRLMEQMEGYEKDNDYVEYKVFVPENGMPEKMKRVAELTMERYNLHVKKLTKQDIFGPEKYGHRVFEVINKTFGHLYGYSQMSEKQIDEYVDMYFKFIELDLICVIEDWNTPNHDCIGVGITIPSLTKALQKCRNGRLWPFGWWHIIRALKFKKTDVVDCLLIGVLPEYRAKGANALLFYDLIPIYQKYGFKWGETHVEMETNGKVQSQWMYFDHEQHKRRRCYKKQL